jgi:hypothetical protein
VASFEERVALAELEVAADELGVLKERAKAHLEEVRTVNKQREDEARRNYTEFLDKHSKARAEARRESDRINGITRCNKCGGDVTKPGGMISDDSYSRFQCPFHKVAV